MDELDNIYCNSVACIKCFEIKPVNKRVDLFPFTKIRLFKYIENFTSKNWKFSDKKTHNLRF